MKRYRDYKIKCSSKEEAMRIFEEIKNKYNKDVTISKEINNNKILQFKIKVNNYPECRIVISLKDTNIAIINIVPTIESGEFYIDENTYSDIIDNFDNVLRNEINVDANKIETNSKEFEIENVLDKETFEKLDLWINAWPLSFHPNDMQRWYDFVISLHRSKSSLSISMFEEWLREKKEWDESNINIFSSKLDDELELLDRYNTLLNQ